MISGPAAAWLESRREELNARLRAARRRYPSLEFDDLSARLEEFLPVNADDPRLLSAVFDLVLLHTGRGTHASPAVGAILRKTLPALKSLVLQRPESIPAALSNAAENLGSRGEEFARVAAGLGRCVSTPEELLDAGALLAWRLGEARLRVAALEAAGRLPAKAVLACLKLAGWPEPAAPLAVSALKADAWRDPGSLFTAESVASLQLTTPGEIAWVEKKLAAPAVATSWVAAGRVGDFTGFGGAFDEPPFLLDAGAEMTRHRFWAMSSEGVFRIDADVFGWACRPDLAADFPILEPPSKIWNKVKLLWRKDEDPPLPKQASGATSFVTAPGFFAYTTADSHRIRVLISEKKAL